MDQEKAAVGAIFSAHTWSLLRIRMENRSCQRAQHFAIILHNHRCSTFDALHRGHVNFSLLFRRKERLTWSIEPYPGSSKKRCYSWVGYLCGAVWCCRYWRRCVVLSTFEKVRNTDQLSGPGGYVAAIKAAQLGLRVSHIGNIVEYIRIYIAMLYRRHASKNAVHSAVHAWTSVAFHRRPCSTTPIYTTKHNMTSSVGVLMVSPLLALLELLSD